MSSATDSESLSLHLRNLVQPPEEVRRAVDTVVKLVAENGPAAEFRLRSTDTDGRQFPFLYLDNKYAPFYHQKLREARLSQKGFVAPCEMSYTAVNPDMSCDTGLEGTGSMEHDGLQQLASFTYGAGRSDSAHNFNDGEKNLFNNPSGDLQQHRAQQRRRRPGQQKLSASMNKKPLSRSQKSAADTDEVTAVHSSGGGLQEEQTLINDCSLPTQATSTTRHVQNPAPFHTSVPYGHLQEVHLLDSSGTERSGLNTFIIVSVNNNSSSSSYNGPNGMIDDDYDGGTDNSTKFPPVPLTACPPRSLAPVHQPRPSEGKSSDVTAKTIYYRLRPDTSTIFRASHHRVLPVGFALGAEVRFLNHDNNNNNNEKNNKKKNNKNIDKDEDEEDKDDHGEQNNNNIITNDNNDNMTGIGIVLRRTVERGQRLYDVKDGRGRMHRDVVEEDLELHFGGRFEFRVPNGV